MSRPLRVALALALLLLSATAFAQGRPAMRKMGVVFRDGVPHLYVSFRDLVTGRTRESLEGGLPQRLVVTHTVRRAGNAKPLSAGGHSCRVVYDLWQAAYRVQFIPDRGAEQRWTLTDREEVLKRCLVVSNVAVGRASHFRSGRTLHVRSLVELNPLSSKTIARIRRWLARPGGGDTMEDNAFFGSFVSLFVNQRIGSAERTLYVRSQDVTVP
jgi:hypothetical protein